MRHARTFTLLLAVLWFEANCLEPQNPVQLFIVCKDVRTRECFAKKIQTDDDDQLATEIKNLPPETEAVCGMSDLKPINLLGRLFKVVSPKRRHATFCKVNKTFIGDRLRRSDDRQHDRTKRDAYSPRGRYRGQTQSQYLSVNGGADSDDGKAEAHSSADVSRAIVSGKSGMGQAQSQTTYDSSCDDCYGRGEPGSEYLYREYIPYIPQIEGQPSGSGVNYNSHKPGTQKPGSTSYPYNPNLQNTGRIPEMGTPNFGGQATNRPQGSDNVGAMGNGNINRIPSSGAGNGGYSTGPQSESGGTGPNNYYVPGPNVGGSNVHTQLPTGQNTFNGNFPKNDMTGGLGTGNIDTRRPDIMGSNSNGYRFSGSPGTQGINGNVLPPNGYGSGTSGGGTGPNNYNSGQPQTGSYGGHFPQSPATGGKQFDNYNPNGGAGQYSNPMATGGATGPGGNGIPSGTVSIQRPGESGTGVGSPEMRPTNYEHQGPNGFNGNTMTPNGFNTQLPSGSGVGLVGNGATHNVFGTQGPVGGADTGTSGYNSPHTIGGSTGSIPQTGTGNNVGVSNPATSYPQTGGGVAQTPYNPSLSGYSFPLPSPNQMPFVGPYTWNQHGQTYFCCVVGPNGLSMPTLSDPRNNGLGYNQAPSNGPFPGINNSNRLNTGMVVPNSVNRPTNGQSTDSHHYDNNQAFMPGPTLTNPNPVHPSVQNTTPMRPINNFPTLNNPIVPNGPTGNWNNGQNTNDGQGRFPGSPNVQNGPHDKYGTDNQNTNAGQNHYPQENLPNMQNTEHGTRPTNNQNPNVSPGFSGSNVPSTQKIPGGMWNTNSQNRNGDQNSLPGPSNPNIENGSWNTLNHNNGHVTYSPTNIPDSQNNPNGPWNRNDHSINGDQNGNNIGHNFPNSPNNNVGNTPNYNWPGGHMHNNNKPNGDYNTGHMEQGVGNIPPYITDHNTMNSGPFQGTFDNGGRTVNTGVNSNTNRGSGEGNYNNGQGGQTTWMPGQNDEHGARPLNVMDPNSISTTLENGDSQASASVDQGPNGTLAQAASDGGIGKGRAKTSVEGQYTGSGTFSAQAQISDETKSAESEVSGGKHGAVSAALSRGGKSKSEASVQLGSETGSVTTNAHSDGSLHSSLTQVQGSVKGGMADAQAKGPGSTSSQAQIGFTPYKEGDKGHEKQKTPFAGGGKSLAQSNGRIGQSESQLHGTFKYGISYTGGAQAGSSIDKDAVFSKRLPFNDIDVFDEKEKNINVETETITEETPKTELTPTTEIDTYNGNVELKNAARNQSGGSPVDHHKSETLQPNSERRSFEAVHDDNVEYEDTTIKEDTVVEDYDSETRYGQEGAEVDGGEGDYANYEEYPREPGSTHQSLRNPKKTSSSIEVKQTTGGNTQHILLGPLRGQNAEITQRNSEQKPDESKVYQPGERVPGTGGYTIPVGFTGSVKSVASKHKTYAIGSKDSPSQAQTVAITPGAGRIKYNDYAKPRNTYARNVHPKDLRSLYSPKQEDDRYVTVSKSVTGALDGDNNIKKQYSHTYYTKSSSCGYFTFTCTIVSGTNGRTKICKPKMPLNPDGTPMKC